MPRARPAFTLVETLVVIAILGLLVGLTAGGVQRVRAAAARAQCLNNLRQLGLAGQQHVAATGAFPAGVTDGNGKDPLRALGWIPRFLPYLEQDELWRLTLAAFAKSPFSGNYPKHPCDRILTLARCPTDPRAGDFHADPAKYGGAAVALSSYLGVNGTAAARENGVLFSDSHVRPADITDGTSNTLLLGERPPSPDRYWGWWYGSRGYDGRATLDLLLGAKEHNWGGLYAGSCETGFVPFGPGKIDNPCDVFHFWSLHPGGAHFALCDGSVRFIRYSAADLLPALATRAGGETATVPD
jgi:prepilin-type N-terminal cleavage/methylation domain-containing protein/prepilin-type processing-associated H-X9-DG protein